MTYNCGKAVNVFQWVNGYKTKNKLLTGSWNYGLPRWKKKKTPVSTYVP